MKSKRKRSKFKIRHIFFLIALIYGLSIFINQQSMIRELNQKKAQKNSEMKNLQSEVIQRDEKLKYVYSPEYIERLAREELGMVRPNEKIFIDKNKNKFVKGIKD